MQAASQDPWDASAVMCRAGKLAEKPYKSPAIHIAIPISLFTAPCSLFSVVALQQDYDAQGQGPQAHGAQDEIKVLEFPFLGSQGPVYSSHNHIPQTHYHHTSSSSWSI